MGAFNGGWENGEIANSSSPSLAASPSVCEREKAYRGEKVTLEKKGLGVTCILRAHGTGGVVVGVSAQCEKGWTVTKERCGFLAAVDQD